MVFKKMLSAFGVGGPSVDTVLANPNTRPGLSLDGQVHLRGGDSPAGIEQVTLALVTRVEMETGEGEYAGLMEFHRMPVSGPFQLAPGQELSIPFQLPVPWETPITDLYGQRLHGMTMGLRTELSVARSVDKGDLDQVSVHPLPLQERILEALLRLGFRFKHADLERGHIYGVQQTLPFYQEIEFFASPQYAHTVNEVELTFITNQYGIDVIIECDKRGGLFSAGHDNVGRFVAQHADADRVDWTAQVNGWLSQTIAAYGSHAAQHGFGGGHGHGHPGPGYGHPGHAYGHPGHGYDHGYDHGRSGHDSGIGGMVVGGALGFAGGLLAGEMLEEVFDDDEGGFFDED